MNKITAKRLAEKYGMEIVRNPITNEAYKLMVESVDLLPELDALTEEDTRPCMVTRRLFCGTTYRYEITCPTAWFDLWGWTDKDEDSSVRALNPLGLYDYIVTGARATEAAADLEQRIDNLSRSTFPISPERTGEIAREIARTYGVVITTTIGGGHYE